MSIFDKLTKNNEFLLSEQQVSARVHMHDFYCVGLDDHQQYRRSLRHAECS